MKYIRNFSAHTDYEGEMSKIPTPSVSYCRKENECHFMPSNVIMFKVGDLNGNTNQTVTVFYYEGGSETIPITEGNKWYVHNIPSGKNLKQFVGIKEITDTIISAKIKYYNFDISALINNIQGNVSFLACDISELTDMSYMFWGCSSLQTLDVTNFDTSKVIEMNGMFSNCSSLQTLDVSNFDTSNVTDMSSMFYQCSSLQTLNLNGWDMTKVTDTDNMFSNCYRLKTIYMMGCNQTTIDKIKSCVSNNVTIITE